jgi:hypothetical protein
VLGWQDRLLVTVGLLYLMFVRLAAWMALLARSSASKDAELVGAVYSVTAVDLVSSAGACGARLLDLTWTGFPAGIIAE